MSTKWKGLASELRSMELHAKRVLKDHPPDAYCKGVPFGANDIGANAVLVQEGVASVQENLAAGVTEAAAFHALALGVRYERLRGLLERSAGRVTRKAQQTEARQRYDEKKARCPDLSMNAICGKVADAMRQAGTLTVKAGTKRDSTIKRIKRMIDLAGNRHPSTSSLNSLRRAKLPKSAVVKDAERRACKAATARAAD